MDDDGITPLLVHPPPRDGDTILGWITTLAGRNNTTTRRLLLYIKEHAMRAGFLPTLSTLTRIPLERIEHMDNDFKDTFWTSPASCSLKRCDFKARNPAALSRHLKRMHGID